MIAKHEATHEMYSPKSPKNTVKSRNTINMFMTLIHILIYIYIFININLLRERMREEGEESRE